MIGNDDKVLIIDNIKNTYAMEENAFLNFINRDNNNIVSHIYNSIETSGTHVMLNSLSKSLENLTMMNMEPIKSSFDSYLSFLNARSVSSVGQLYTTWYPNIVRKYRPMKLLNFVKKALKLIDVVILNTPESKKAHENLKRLCKHVKTNLGDTILDSSIPYNTPFEDIVVFDINGSDSTYRVEVDKYSLTNTFYPFVTSLSVNINNKQQMIANVEDEISDAYQLITDYIDLLTKTNTIDTNSKRGRLVYSLIRKVLNEVNHAATYLILVLTKDCRAFTYNASRLPYISYTMDNISNTSTVQVLEELDWYKQHLFPETYDMVLEHVKDVCIQYAAIREEEPITESTNHVSNKALRRLYNIRNMIIELKGSYCSSSNIGYTVEQTIDNNANFASWDKLLTENVDFTECKSYNMAELEDLCDKINNSRNDLHDTITDIMETYTEDVELIEYMEQTVRPNINELEYNMISDLIDTMIEHIQEEALTESYIVTPNESFELITEEDNFIDELKSIKENHKNVMESILLRDLLYHSLYSKGYDDDVIQAVITEATETTPTDDTTTDQKVSEAKKDTTEKPTVIVDKNAENSKKGATSNWVKQVMEKISKWLNGIVTKTKENMKSGALSTHKEYVEEARKLLPDIKFDDRFHIIAVDYESKISNDELINIIKGLSGPISALDTAMNRADATLNNVLRAKFPFLTKYNITFDDKLEGSALTEEVKTKIRAIFITDEMIRNKKDFTGQELELYIRNGLDYMEDYFTLERTLTDMNSDITNWNSKMKEDDTALYESNPNATTILKKFSTAYSWIINTILNIAYSRERQYHEAISQIVRVPIANENKPNEPEETQTPEHNTEPENT